VRTCIRCLRQKENFPKPGNELTCGGCLHALHEMHKGVEEARIPRGV
jgi:hypothetical protein